MSGLKELFKGRDKKSILYIAAALIIGLFLLITSGSFFSQPEIGVDSGGAEPASRLKDTGTGSYESMLEARLEEALSLADGVGNVKVMITLSYGKEIVLAEDIRSEESSTKEVDAQGGSRETTNGKTENNKIILPENNGGSQPLILKEIQPKIQGVIIIAEGGENIFIKDALIRAAQTILGVEANKVEVLKMK